MLLGRRSWLGMSLVATGTLVACGGGGGSPNGAGNGTDGSLSVLLMDAPVDNVTQVHVQIAALWLKPADDGAAIELPMATSPITVDLMALTEENAAVLVDNAIVPVGSYEWLSMDVNAEHDGVMDSYVMTTIGGQEDLEIRVPSGRIRLVSDFEVEANLATRFLFDWDLRTGLVNPPGLPGYLLKPAFRVLEVDEYGALAGTVATNIVTSGDGCRIVDPDQPDLDPDTGNVVYVFAAADVPADAIDDIDGTDPEPVATAVAGFNDEDGYDYRVVLMPGDYTVAFTCEADKDNPETSEDITFLTPTPTNVNMVAGVEEIVDF